MENEAKPVSEEKDDEEQGEAPEQYEIDSWVRTLLDAEEIKADSDKMKYVKPALDKKAGAIKKLGKYTSTDQLREKAKAMGAT